jgi:quinol-cytochrome oxidoreductase complex cytochrome b subunit/coenzyme F420-reducing hydrogenase delta subunit/Pyruvate/2-oxoacid:ferredoxin oxidoreductase delta subunit
MTQDATASYPAYSGGASVLRAPERAFDRVFQAAANPWRHLGALAFFFFWIVTASGIYLYIFYDTSVEGAYRSVEALTHDQPYAGGVMRSLHRYASAAMVVVVVAHLLKELLSGRFAGFRWFSWVSGVPLLWLMLASGIVGYWLVWDGLGQFVAVATAEWFDVLPIFSEPLIRNFLAPGSVNDRLFTLLIFLHIALPLALLLGMFVHVQRVNYADVAPGRVLGWGTFLALLVLALARPATSQGPADLALAPQAVALDWFYLALYPLIYEWSAHALWGIAAAGTFALLVLPFVTRRARPPAAQVDPVNCNGCGRCFADCPYGAVVLRPRQGGEPGREQAVVFPGLCASCGICTGACPSSTPFRSAEPLATGIDMPQQPIDAVRRALERELAHPQFARRVVVFGCACGAATAGCGRPGATAIRLLCIGMLSPAFIEYALRLGADGVLIAACREGECAYRLGDRWLAGRLAGAREPHLRPTVPRERVRLVRAGPGEEDVLESELAAFGAELAAMPRNARRRSSRDRLTTLSMSIGKGSNQR